MLIIRNCALSSGGFACGLFSGGWNRKNESEMKRKWNNKYKLYLYKYCTNIAFRNIGYFTKYDNDKSN